MYGLLLLVCLAADPDVPVAAGTSPPSAAVVASLVRRLDAPQLAARDRAEAELLQLGPAVLPLLPADSAPLGAEVLQRIARVRGKLQRARAAEGVQASRVSLRTEGMPVAKILETLSQQSGNRIRLRTPAASGDAGLRETFDNAPFWPTLDRVLDASGRTFYPFGEGREIAVDDMPGTQRGGEGRRGRSFVSYDGAFRFEVTGLAARRNMREPGQSSLQVDFLTAWEPRTAPILLRLRAAEMTVRDDTGVSLLPELVDAGGAKRPSPTWEATVGPGEIAKSIVIPLELPRREARRLAVFRGTVTAVVPVGRAAFRFRDPASTPRAEQRIGSAGVVLDRVVPNGKMLEVRILVRFDRVDDALASHRTWIFNNPAFLEDRQGKRILPETSTPTLQTETEVGLSYVFPTETPSADLSFVYETPTAILTKSLGFSMQDVPLP